MKILLTGATGYIAKRLLPELIEGGNFIVCCVRDKQRFNVDPAYKDQIEVVEVDFLIESDLAKLPLDIDAAYYLMHSMSSAIDYQNLESQSAQNFKEYANKTAVQQVLYLSGIVNESQLSKHLRSRKNVEDILASGDYPLTTLRAGIIIGSGSASFEIIRDLVEKLPVMIAPKWLKTKCQPIAVSDVVLFLKRSLLNKATYHQDFDIGGRSVLTYHAMLMGYARLRGLRRLIITVPVMTPRLSSYWLYFVTSVSFKLASALVSSMKVEVICRDSRLADLLNIQPLDYNEALQRTLQRITEQQVPSSWKDAAINGNITSDIQSLKLIPYSESYVDHRTHPVTDYQATLNRIWSLGGDKGWYAANGLWQLRGFVDKLFGGVGLRRGRTHQSIIHPGDAIDFWRVVEADFKSGRLLLYAEMKLPGQAWLEFTLTHNSLEQKAIFKPHGILGRLYWYSVLPFHGFIFKKMNRKIAGG
jgi:uncharacterized protein YbjT (DUF2867 family)